MINFTTLKYHLSFPSPRFRLEPESIRRQSLIKPHDPIAVMLGLDPGIHAFPEYGLPRNCFGVNDEQEAPLMTSSHFAIAKQE